MTTHSATQDFFDVRLLDGTPGVTAPPQLRVIANGKVEDRAAEPVRWTPPVDVPTTSRASKSGAFALTLLAHALAIGCLATLRSEPNEKSIAPTQFVIVAPEHNADEVAKPPEPTVEIPKFDVPIVAFEVEPVIQESNAVTIAQQSVAAPTTSSANVDMPKEVSSVEYIREPIAKYPPAARALKQRGVVTLRALIDAEGHALEVAVHRSSGYKLLDDAARKAVMTALFKPYKEDGRPMPVYVLIPIEFGAA